MKLVVILLFLAFTVAAVLFAGADVDPSSAFYNALVGGLSAISLVLIVSALKWLVHSLITFDPSEDDEKTEQPTKTIDSDEPPGL